jgi:hypothetical protein
VQASRRVVELDEDAAACRRLGSGTQRGVVERVPPQLPEIARITYDLAVVDLGSCRCEHVPAGPEVVQVLPG